MSLIYWLVYQHLTVHNFWPPYRNDKKTNMCISKNRHFDNKNQIRENCSHWPYWHLAFKTFSGNRYALDRLERSEEPDAIWMVRSLPCYLHQVEKWWTIPCCQPPRRLCPHHWKGNTHYSQSTILILLCNHTSFFSSEILLKQDGKWADHMCEKTNGYICKKKASITPGEGAREEANPGCKLVGDVISCDYHPINTWDQM